MFLTALHWRCAKPPKLVRCARSQPDWPTRPRAYRLARAWPGGSVVPTICSRQERRQVCEGERFPLFFEPREASVSNCRNAEGPCHFNLRLTGQVVVACLKALQIHAGTQSVSARDTQCRKNP